MGSSMAMIWLSINQVVKSENFKWFGMCKFVTFLKVDLDQGLVNFPTLAQAIIWAKGDQNVSQDLLFWAHKALETFG